MGHMYMEVMTYVLLAISVFLASYAYMMVFQGKMKSRILTMFLFFASELIIELFLRYVWKNYSVAFSFLCDVLFYLGLRILYQGKRRYHLLAVIIMDLTSTLAEVGGILIVMNFTSINYDEFAQYTPTFFVCAIFCNTFLAMLIMIELTIFKAFTKRVNFRYLILYILVPIYQLILLVVYYQNIIELSAKVMWWGLLMLIFGILIDIFMVHTVDTMLEKITVEKELSRLYEQRQMEFAYYESTQTYLDRMSVIRHEFNNRIQTIYSILSQNGISPDSSELLDATNSEIINTKLDCYCENVVLNSVLFCKKSLAEQKGIQMDVSVAVSEQIEIAKIDLCSMFCNLLDNAIEACEKLDGTEEHVIQIKAYEKAGYLVVRVENPIDRSVEMKMKKRNQGVVFETTKADEQNHGYGIRLIQQIVREYDGDFRVEKTENSFAVMLTVRAVRQH